MKHEEFQPHLSKLVGSKVFNKFIVCNSIILWVDAPAKMPFAKCLWIDPPWRIESGGSITTTSASLPHEPDDEESDDEYKVLFTSACKASDIIESASITDISINQGTSDLVIAFNNGQTLRTFTVWTDEENWTLSNYQTNEKFSVNERETLVSQLNA